MSVCWAAFSAAHFRPPGVSLYVVPPGLTTHFLSAAFLCSAFSIDLVCFLMENASRQYRATLEHETATSGCSPAISIVHSANVPNSSKGAAWRSSCPLKSGCVFFPSRGNFVDVDARPRLVCGVRAVVVGISRSGLDPPTLTCTLSRRPQVLFGGVFDIGQYCSSEFFPGDRQENASVLFDANFVTVVEPLSSISVIDLEAFKEFVKLLYAAWVPGAIACGSHEGRDTLLW